MSTEHNFIIHVGNDTITGVVTTDGSEYSISLVSCDVTYFYDGATELPRNATVLVRDVVNYIQELLDSSSQVAREHFLYYKQGKLVEADISMYDAREFLVNHLQDFKTGNISPRAEYLVDCAIEYLYGEESRELERIYQSLKAD